MDNLSDSADAAAAGADVTAFLLFLFFLFFKKKKFNQFLFSADLQVALPGDGDRRWRA